MLKRFRSKREEFWGFDVKTSDQTALLTWQGPHDGQYTLKAYRHCSAFCDAKTEEISVVGRMQRYQMTPGHIYTFELFHKGRGPLTLEGISSKPSAPSGVMAYFFNGLEIKWKELHEPVTYNVSVTTEQRDSSVDSIFFREEEKILAHDKDIVDCHYRIEYDLLVNQLMSAPFRVAVWAENETGLCGPKSQIQKEFDGNLTASYFLAARHTDILACFVIGGTESVDRCKDSCKERGFLPIDDVEKCIKLLYGGDYEVCLTDHTKGTTAPALWIGSSGQKIHSDKLLYDQFYEVKFTIQPKTDTHYFELGIKNKDVYVDTHPFTWNYTDRDLSGVSAEPQKANARTTAAKRDTKKPESGRISDERSAILKEEPLNTPNLQAALTKVPRVQTARAPPPIPGAKNQEFKIQVRLFVKPGVINLVVCRGDPNDDAPTFPDCRLVEIQSTHSILKDEKLEASLDCDSGLKIEPYSHSLTPEKIFSREVVSKQFTYDGGDGDLRMHLQLKQRGQPPYKQCFDMNHPRPRQSKQRPKDGNSEGTLISGANIHSISIDGANIAVTGNQGGSSRAVKQYRGDANCHNTGSRTAQNMADNGGTITRNEHGTANQLYAGKQK